jgi:hypothetical protein
MTLMVDLVAIFSDPANIAALATIIAMEVVLGIDNLIFISILTNKLPEHQRSKARRVGISGALILRLAFLSLVFLIVRLTEPVVTVFDHSFSWRDMILIAGGGFLVWKATKEIHHNVDPEPTPGMFGGQASMTFTAAIGQILLLDAVFSIDSINYRRWHDRSYSDHGDRDPCHRGGDAACGEPTRQIHPCPSERGDAGIGLSSDDRNDPYCRGLRYESSQRLHIRSDAILGVY